jgi:hypothetical protein
MLNANRQSEQVYEVINGGVSRFGTDNELLFYQFEGSHYQPNLVLLLFYHNDITDNVERSYFELVEGELAAIEPKPTDVLGPGGKIRGWLWDHLQIYRLGMISVNVLANLLGLGPTPVEHRSMELYRTEYIEEINYAWALTGALLEEINRVTEADGAELVVVGISDIGALESTMTNENLDWTRPNHELAGYLNESGIPYIDLLPAFQSHHELTTEPLFWPGDKHWNTAGHRLAAETICDELSQRDILACHPINYP